MFMFSSLWHQFGLLGGHTEKRRPLRAMSPNTSLSLPHIVLISDCKVDFPQKKTKHQFSQSTVVQARSLNLFVWGYGVYIRK